jgi:hypothetical protein
MAEHGTRNRRGLNTTGLLFGTEDEIVDTVDVPESAFDTVVALQMAVYPHQQVVGWYKVVVGTTSSTSIITAADLELSRRLQSRFPAARYLVTLDGQSNVAVWTLDDGTGDGNTTTTTSTTAPSSVLIHTEFSLETTTAERIAVERLLREDKWPAKMAQMDHSIDVLADRIDTLLHYLESGKTDPSTLRRIQSVLCNARLLQHGTATSAANTTTSMSDMTDPFAAVVADVEGLAMLADTVALTKAYAEQTRPGKSKGNNNNYKLTI